MSNTTILLDYASQSSTINLNSSGISVLFYFSYPSSLNLSGVKIDSGGTIGSVVASNIVINLYATDSNRLKTGTSLASGIISDPGWGTRTCSFSSPYITTPNLWYVVEVKNINSNPASNYIGIVLRSCISEYPFPCQIESYDSNLNERTQWSTFGFVDFGLMRSSDTSIERPGPGYVLTGYYSYNSFYWGSSTTNRKWIGNRVSFNKDFVLTGLQVCYSTGGAALSNLNAVVEIYSSSSTLLSSGPMYLRHSHWGDYINVQLTSPLQLSKDLSYYFTVRGNVPFSTAWNDGLSLSIMTFGIPSDDQSGTIIKNMIGVTNSSTSATPSTWNTVSNLVFITGIQGYVPDTFPMVIED